MRSVPNLPCIGNQLEKNVKTFFLVKMYFLKEKRRITFFYKGAGKEESLKLK